MTTPKYLFILASTCQFYSGTGRAIFDWIDSARNDFQFSVLMDVQNVESYRRVAAFCSQRGIRLELSAPQPLAGCPDPGVAAVGSFLSREHFDFVECVGWANAATNLNVATVLPKTTQFVFVPHFQPVWTLPGHREHFLISAAFGETVRRAEFTFVDSPIEARLAEFCAAPPGSVHFVPLGVNSNFFYASCDIKRLSLVCVCDYREPRKRADLLIQAFSRALRLNPGLRLILVGKGSDSVEISGSISASVDRLGYVEEHALAEIYRTSDLLVLLSDYEAFGLPIAEALTCGCPVLLNELEVLRSLFDDCLGVEFVSNTDLDKTAKMMCSMVADPHNRQEIASAATSKFSSAITYKMKTNILLGRIAA